jgi:hypothetical protein
MPDVLEGDECGQQCGQYAELAERRHVADREDDRGGLRRDLPTISISRTGFDVSAPCLTAIAMALESTSVRWRRQPRP